MPTGLSENIKVKLRFIKIFKIEQKIFFLTHLYY
jgi:hypothetical protein